MGNICAIDMGIVIMRISVFDRYNQMYPYDIYRQIKERADQKAKS
jgi:hypothetical protein